MMRSRKPVRRRGSCNYRSRIWKRRMPNSKSHKEATSQAMVEIKKHDALQARFTRLEGQHFDISQKIDCLQLVHNQTIKKVGELEHRVKSAEEALPQRVQKAIFYYQRSVEFRLETGKEAVYYLCRFTKTYKDVNPSIVVNYEEFIQEYLQEWFAPLDLSAPLTPISEEEEEEGDPSATADAPIS
ncbi:hypothetical protein LIER_02309 [Lithospermum erythrorhizon]|uniref:Uncharacterized protein n=1 Tax=Lithospermum erythrorhizon TaxID=34254 RepID=A0AAV3NNZ3_LITER